jgi:hypothetical protein
MMADIKETLFSETEGACAYCGIKDYRILTIHHIVQSEPKDESYDNKIVLCHNCHHIYHEQKGPSLEDLITIKKRLIYKTLTQQGINTLKEVYRKGLVVASPYLVNHLVEMQLLEYSEPLSSLGDDETNISVDIDAIYKLTDRGKKFVEKWNLY